MTLTPHGAFPEDFTLAISGRISHDLRQKPNEHDLPCTVFLLDVFARNPHVREPDRRNRELGAEVTLIGAEALRALRELGRQDTVTIWGHLATSGFDPSLCGEFVKFELGIDLFIEGHRLLQTGTRTSFSTTPVPREPSLEWQPDFPLPF